MSSTVSISRFLISFTCLPIPIKSAILTRMEQQEIIEQVKQIIGLHLQSPHRIFLFGSWAKGTAIETSDLDIAILSQEKIPWATMTNIKQAVEAIPTLRSIDILDLNAVTEEFKKRILEEGKEL